MKQILIPLIIIIFTLVLYFFINNKMNNKIGRNEFNEIPNDFHSVYSIELLYREKPQFNIDKMIESVNKYCGNVDISDKKEEANTIFFTHLDHKVMYKDGEFPAQCLLIFPEDDKDRIDFKNLEEPLQHCWIEWEDGKEIVESCNHAIKFTDMMAAGLKYKERVNIFRRNLRGIVENTNCDAIAWYPSGKIVNPKVFLTSQEKDSEESIASGFISVRIFNIHGSDDILMDTRGLSSIGLPDLQCHFKNLDSEKVFILLYATAYYIFENGDAIEDGNTISGIDNIGKWKCRHEKSLTEPSREVIDINPGKPYAAGER